MLLAFFLSSFIDAASVRFVVLVLVAASAGVDERRF